MSVENILIRYPSISENTSIDDIYTCMSEAEHPGVVVLNQEETPLGLISARHLLECLNQVTLGKTESDEVQPEGLNAVAHVKISVEKAVRQLLLEAEDVLVLVNDQRKYVGIARLIDLLKLKDLEEK